MAETNETIALARANEQLRQEKESFDLRLGQSTSDFKVRRAMGWIAVLILPSILALSASIILRHDQFSEGTVTAATAALLVDGLGTAFSLYKLVLGSASNFTVEPLIKDQRRAKSSKSNGS